MSDQQEIIAQAEAAFAEWWDGPEPHTPTLLSGFIAGYRTAIAKGEAALKACRQANAELTARMADTEGALREIDGWLNGDHIGTMGDASRSWKEAGAIARAALEKRE